MSLDLFYRLYLKSLVLPPGLFIVMLAVALVAWRWRFSRVLVFITAAGLYLLSTLTVEHWLAKGLETYPPVVPSALRTQGVKALVVLMAGKQIKAPELGADTVDRMSMDRLAYAVRLHRETNLPIILSGGGYGKNAPAFAELGAEALTTLFGITPIALETNSRSTWQNAHEVAQVLRELKIEKIAVVTHAWHMPRALYSFSQAGVSAVAAPTYYIHRVGKITPSNLVPTAASLRNSIYALYEYAGLIWYHLALGDN